MTSEEKVELIQLMLDQPQIIDNIYNKYNSYKRENVYFYVPATIYCSETSLNVDIGDKSYSSLEELRGAVMAWSEDKIADIEPFLNILWNNKENDINVLFLIETDEYSFGTVTRFPTKR
jgi:hypothetical protein